MGKITFLDNDGTFTMKQPENYSGLYFPVAGEKGLKGCVTPNFGGDSKIGQNSFLMEPVSIENLNNNRTVRNFWCMVEGKGLWSAVGASARQESEKFTPAQDESEMEAGFMWQTVCRSSREYELGAKVSSFALLDQNVEVMTVCIENKSSKVQKITPVTAVPIFGRSADNLRDHRHVTSLLHRIETEEYGVRVCPALSFDERGHQKNELTYFVAGITGDGQAPISYYPVMDAFMGEGGTMIHPRSLLMDEFGVPAGTLIEGKEALGGLRFAAISLKPGEQAFYTIFIGILDKDQKDMPLSEIVSSFDQKEKVLAEKKRISEYWKKKVNVAYYTGNKEMDGFLKWVSFQPMLRRIYGCSFLPHHDYGRGGRGWRDLWQDCLSLLIMDPGQVHRMIVDNYGGVRMDGTNATIIGEKQGEFIADRNGIARVWMDHGVWPFITTRFYLNQTGDVDILKEKAVYFKDEQCGRGRKLDKEWQEDYGVKHRTAAGEVYEGTVLEHILLEQLCAFYEVGEHNIMQLRGADWNDALDMAAENGESVAFSCAYAGNLKSLSDLLFRLKEEYAWGNIELLEEMLPLFTEDASIYEDAQAKRALLEKYADAVKHQVSGKKIQVEIDLLAENLKKKADWLMEKIRRQEWIEGQDAHGQEGWFNSYYDNHKQKVEGYFPNEVRMMLTGQVFSIMSGTASEEQVGKICHTADKYLYKEEAGGYRLNTNFHEEKMDLGRMFGFAYGEKENGAVFSHMTVMYANALYQRGFVKEGYKALQTLAAQAVDFERSYIYPGIPEYFDAQGRGLYHYLTGAASWYMLTMITEVFGVSGDLGTLSISPKLQDSQFDDEGRAGLCLDFGGKHFDIRINNPRKLSYGAYKITDAVCDGIAKLGLQNGRAVLDQAQMKGLGDGVHVVEVVLGE